MEKAKKNRRIIFSNKDEREDNTEEMYMQLEDERGNLDIKTEGRIIGIADIGTWNGRVSGYVFYGNNIRNILYTECDTVEWYSDGSNIKGRMGHHDGVNYVEYREVRESRNIEVLTSKLYNGEEVTRQQINYYTKSIAPYVHRVYGWGTKTVKGQKSEGKR